MQLLFACTQSPAVVENRSIYKKGASYEELSRNPFKIRVQGGDTLYKISKKYGVGIRELIEINNLRPPYLLSPSQVIKLPKAKFHMVNEGDTLYAVSRSYGVDLSRLIHVNNLNEPFIIKQGEKLRIPSLTQSYQYVAKAVTKPVIVQKGELSSITQRDIGKLNKEPDQPKYILPNEVKLGRVSDASNNTGSNGLLKPKLRPGVYPRPNLKPETRRQLASNPKKKMKYQKASYSTKVLSRNNVAKARGFDWPARGTIISRFGPKKGGLYNDGINIRAAEGTSVFASDNGMVVYAGNELRGYGNLVLLKHSNGFVTAYAHANNIFVKKGQVVKKGQKIASVGSTGHVSVPQLHFSIRKGRKAINPQSYLPRG